MFGFKLLDEGEHILYTKAELASGSPGIPQFLPGTNFPNTELSRPGALMSLLQILFPI